MSRRKAASLFAGYGFREESISLFEKLARDGIAATAPSRMGLRDDPTGHLGLIPIESIDNRSVPSPLLERGRRDPARIILVRPFIQKFILDRDSNLLGLRSAD
jgi:hypothetical protein